MHTFVVRLFVAEDVDEFAGVVEEPVTGMREGFHDAAELVGRLEDAIGRRSSRDDDKERQAADAEDVPSSPRSS
jgi:hypothetical protein